MNMTFLKPTVAALVVAGAALLAAAPANADALEDIAKAGQLNVGVFADFPPFSSASADMSLKGYDDGRLNASSEAWLKTPLNPDNLKD